MRGNHDGSVSRQYKAWRFEYKRTDQTDEYAAVIYARTRQEADRKFYKTHVGPDRIGITEVLRVWCLDYAIDCDQCGVKGPDVVWRPLPEEGVGEGLYSCDACWDRTLSVMRANGERE